ncbi:MAG: InlB B-repeat-containing protein [Treponema sp.]|jgi:uncharacterized repeat protein (TIGR02543 family)|nr:InlB B-repeat-containing protein [Treponema sp.]
MNKKMLFLTLLSIYLIIVSCSPLEGDIHRIWEDRNIGSATVTFDINEGTGTMPVAQTAKIGNNITLPNSSGFSRSGFTFAGWNTNANGTETNYNANSLFRINENVTLFANWIKILGIGLLAGRVDDNFLSPVPPPLLAPGARRHISAYLSSVSEGGFGPGPSSGSFTIVLVRPSDWDCTECEHLDEDQSGCQTCEDEWKKVAALSIVPLTNPVRYLLTISDTAIIDEDSIKIRATAEDLDEDGELMVVYWEIDIKDDPSEIDITNWAFQIYYDESDEVLPDGANTTTLLAVNDRYTIVNNNPTATMYTGAPYFRESTFVYLNKGFLWDWNQEYGMEMRVKLTHHGSAGIIPDVNENTNHGFLVGAFSDPKAMDNSSSAAMDRLQFVGIRGTVSGLKTRYATNDETGGTASSGSMYGSFSPSLGLHDGNTDKVEGFVDQEYIYRVRAIGPGAFMIEVLTPDGEEVLVSQVRSGASLLGPYLSNSANFAYMGIIVANATVEISGIKYWEGSSMWEDQDTKDAVMEPINVRSFTIDYDPFTHEAGYYSIPLYANVVPRTAAAHFGEIEWSIDDPDDMGFLDFNNEVKADGLTMPSIILYVDSQKIGEVIVEATLTPANAATLTDDIGPVDYKFGIIQ